MQGVQGGTGRAVARYLAAAVGAASLLAIPAVSAVAAPAPTPAGTSDKPGGLSLQLGSLSLNLPLALNVPGLLQIGDTGSSTPAPPTSSEPSTPPTSPSTGTSEPPPTSTHSTPPNSATSTSSAAPPPPSSGDGGQFNPPPSSRSSAPSSTAPSTSVSSSTTKDRPEGTGSLVLKRLDDGSEVMIAVLLAVTAVAVIVFARLGGVRRRKPSERQH